MRLPRLTPLFLLLFGMPVGGCLAVEPQVPAQPAVAARHYTPAELRADFEQMYRELQAAHFNLYAFISKRGLDRLYRVALTKMNRPLTLLDAKIKFEMFLAHVRMGHTRVASPLSDWQQYRSTGGKGFPLQIRIVDGRSYVAVNLSGVPDIKPGDEIIALDHLPMRQWLARAERHVSAETSYMAHSLMEYDFAIYLWIERGSVADYELDLVSAGRKSYRVKLPARSDAEMEAARALQPPALDLEHPLREARILEGHVAYLRPGPFYNVDAKTAVEEWDVSGFRSFIDQSFQTFANAGADRLIIDLRGNPGGDNLFSDVLVAWIASRPFRFAAEFKIRVSAESIAANAERIAHDAAAAGPISQRFADLYARSAIGEVVDFDIPEALPRPDPRFRGKVFVLIDRQSYSNAVSVAALIQDYKFGRILGEATSDMATTYGAMEQFRLSNTGLMIGYPKARIVRPSGDLRAKGVSPDILIRIPIVQGPDDPVLQSALAIARAD